MPDPRGTRQQRGYGAEHDKIRARWTEAVALGHAHCARCRQPIKPGEPWHLDHRDDRTGYLGPSHARCNIAAAAAPREARTPEKHPGLL